MEMNQRPQTPPNSQVTRFGDIGNLSSDRFYDSEMQGSDVDEETPVQEDEEVTEDQ